MTDLSPTLFQLEQVLSFEQTISSCHLTSCGKLGVAIVKNDHAHLVVFLLGQDEVKTHWVSWFNDPLLVPQTLCFSSQDDLLLIGTCSGILSVIPAKLLFMDTTFSSSSKKVRIVRARDEAEIGRRAMPSSICWWATNESKALAILGTNHGYVIIIDLVDGKEIGFVKVSEKAIVKLEQITDNAKDNTYLFITDIIGKQWRQLLEQRSTGFTWCGANEAASHPKTPTLEKAAAGASLDTANPMDKSPEPSEIEEEFTTRSRLAGLKQMSVASIASLRQRLGETRKIFDRKFQNQGSSSNNNYSPNGHHLNHLTVPVMSSSLSSSSNSSDCLPESLASKVGATQLQVQSFSSPNGQKVISGLFKDTAILTMHNYELEVLPQVAFKLPKQTDIVLILDKLMVVRINRSTLKIVSAHHAEISLDKSKEDPVLQSFTLPSTEFILSFHKLKNPSIPTSLETPCSTDASSSSTSTPSSSEDRSLVIPNPCDKLSEEVKAKVNAARNRGQAMVQPCLIVTSKAIYILRLDEDPVSAFLDMTTHGLVREADKIAACFELDSKSLIELAADIKLTKGDFAGAISLYRQSSCKHLKAVLKFAASGHVNELLSYLNVLFKTVNLEVSNNDKIHLANLALMAYFQQALASESSTIDELRDKLKAFLDNNQWFDECLAVRLAAETREWTLLGHMAVSRGLHGDMLMAIAGAFSQLLALETDNVKHLQDAMTKVLQEMPASERKGLVLCLVYQRDNLATCLAFPALGEQIVRILIGLLPLLEEQDLMAVIEQCRPDRPDLMAVLWPLATLDLNLASEFGLMLINFYITVQLLYIKKAASSSVNCNPNLVKTLAKAKQRPIQALKPLVKIRVQPNLMAAGFSHVLLIRPKYGQLMSWGTAQFGVLGHTTTMASSRFSTPKAIEFFSGLCKGHQRISVISVACGRTHSMALTDCGLYLWGSSKHGQLGLGTSVMMAKKPTLVAALAQEVIVGISAGNYHSAAWDENGRAWTWGWGVHGQLGHDSIEDEFLPTRLILSDRIISVACGHAHTVVLTIKGQVWTFGCGLFGQLGIGEIKKKAIPSLVDLEVKIAQIKTGFFHTLAFDAEGQKLYTWGCNPQVLRTEAHMKRKGRMQNKIIAEETGQDIEAAAEEAKKSEAEEEMLHLLPSLLDTSLFSVASVACGNQHSMILTSSGSILAFGRNMDGQLGIGSRKDAKLPTLVSGLKDDLIIEIVCGADFSLAMSEAGSVFVWGGNGGGQHGKPPLEDATTNKDTNTKIVVMKSTKRIIR